MNSGKDTKESGIGRFTGRVMSAWQYVSAGVWSDPRRKIGRASCRERV